jgi:organic radical activating enzyme
MRKLYLSECFYSLQGEGKRVGIPSIFIRFTGCNMECQGFGVKYNDPITGELKYGCDSYYAVDKSFKNQ